MEQSDATAFEPQSELSRIPAMNEAYASGVSWAAVIAGAFVTAALALILLTLGTGLNLSMTPATPTGDFKVGPSTILWLIIIQIIASAMGGYLAGRLRTKWAAIHTDEVYFRDTAHGFLVWAVALVITASFLALSASSMLAGSFIRSNAEPGQTSGSEGSAQFNLEPNAYFIDSLFRSDRLGPLRTDLYTSAEAARIFAYSLRQNNMSVTDRTYVARLITAQTGLGQVAAENRVSLVFTEVQDAANANRRTLAHLSLWAFIALLIGAFSASLAATIGGKERDRVQLVTARSAHLSDIRR
jgi:hypothetical protein